MNHITLRLRAALPLAVVVLVILGASVARAITYNPGETLTPGCGPNDPDGCGVTAPVTTLNGLTGVSQTFAVGTAGTDFGISSSSTTHTFNLPDASATARGLITTGAQAFAGAKSFSSTLALSGSSANIALGSNYLSGDGGDEGISVDSSGNVGIGNATPARPLSITSNINNELIRMHGPGTDIAPFDLTYQGFANGAPINDTFSWSFNTGGVEATQPIYSENLETRWVTGSGTTNGILERYGDYTSVDRGTNYRPWSFSINQDTNNFSYAVFRLDSLRLGNSDDSKLLTWTGSTGTLATSALSADRAQIRIISQPSEPVTIEHPIGSGIKEALRISSVLADPVGSGNAISFYSPRGDTTVLGGMIYNVLDAATFQDARMTLGSMDAAANVIDTISIKNGMVGIGPNTHNPGGYGGKVDIRFPDTPINRANTPAQLFVGDTATSQTAGSGGRIDLGGFRGADGNQSTWGGMKGAAEAASGNMGYLAFFTQYADSGLYERMRLDGNGNVGIGATTLNTNAKLTVAGSAVIGTVALATNATNGFLYIPTSAGAPTGVPTAQTGTVPMEYDTTNDDLCIYNGAWRCISFN